MSHSLIFPVRVPLKYSLEWFINLFEIAIDKAPKANVLEDRLRNLTDCFTEVLYKNVCRSLFEKHKLLFSFLLSVKIMQGEGRMDGEELRFFLQGATSLDVAEPNPLEEEEGSWLTDKTWSEIVAAEKLSSMSHFAHEFKSNLSVWESVFVSEDPLADIEEIVNDNYNPFQKLCILRAIRPDALVPAVQMFIGQVGLFRLFPNMLTCCIRPTVTYIQFGVIYCFPSRHRLIP